MRHRPEEIFAGFNMGSLKHKKKRLKILPRGGDKVRDQ
jgi:hypothetical protein